MSKKKRTWLGAMIDYEKAQNKAAKQFLAGKPVDYTELDKLDAETDELGEELEPELEKAFEKGGILAAMGVLLGGKNGR